MIFRRTTNQPVTTERRLPVESEDGTIRGYADVRWVAGFARLDASRIYQVDRYEDGERTRTVAEFVTIE